MTDFLDSADISGVPQQQTGPHQPPGQTQPQVDQFRNRYEPPSPGAAPSEEPPQPPAGPKPRAPHPRQQQQQNLLEGLFGDIEHELQQQQQRQPFKKLNPFNPVDWPKEFANDGANLWGLSRDVYMGLQGLWNRGSTDSIQNIWGRSDAKSKLLQNFITTTMLQTGLISPAGAAYTDVTGRQEPGAVQFAQQVAGQPVPRPGQTPAQRTQAGIQALPQVGMMAAAPETAPEKAGLAAAYLLPQLLQNQDMTPAELGWALMTTALMVGHIPGAGKLVGKIFKGWPQVQDAVTESISRMNRQKAGMNANTYVQDYISQVMRYADVPSTRTTIAKAARPEEEELKRVTFGPDDSIQIRELDRSKQVRAVMRRLGVQDQGGLLEKAAAQAYTRPQMDFLRRHFADIGMPYDLEREMPGDVEYRDPRAAYDAIQGTSDLVQREASTKAKTALHDYLHEIHQGPFATGGDPTTSLWRSLLGLNRASRSVDDGFKLALHGLGEGVDGKLVTRAIEGDLDVYKNLSDAGKQIVDSVRLLGKGLMHQAKDTEAADEFVANWFPRRAKDMIPRARGRPLGGRVWTQGLTTEARRHRELTLGLDENGRLIQKPKYATVQESNRAMGSERSRITRLLADPSKALPPDLQRIGEAKQIQKLARTNPEQAALQARSFAARLAPSFEEDFWKVLDDGAYRRQLAAVHSHQALEGWKGTWMKVTDPITRSDAPERAVVHPKDNHEATYYRNLGYRYTGHPLFGSQMFHKDLADLIDRAAPQLHDSLLGKGMSAAAAIERVAIKSIMYSAAVHAPNVLGRAGWLTFSHPMDLFALLRHQRGLTQEAARQEARGWQLKMMNSGFVPHNPHFGVVRNVEGVMQDVFGDTFQNDLPEVPDLNRWEKLAQSVGESVPGRAYNETLGRAQRWTQNLLWSKTNDFGLLAARLEYEGMLRSGIPEEEATLRAARRGMTWAGMVAPEDKSPLWANAGRIMFFAPNWWRTFGELLLPIYRRSGVPVSQELMKHVMWNQLKTMAGMMTFQHVTGNALNLLMSGQLQAQNQTGQQDKIQVTRPELIRFLQDVHYPGAEKIDPQTGEDPNTGGRLYMENPLTRQTYDLERALGFQSTYTNPQTHSDAWTPQNAQEGSAAVLAARMSPFLSAVSAAGNVDLYQSIRDGEIRHVEPYQGWTPMNLIYGATYMTPLGVDLSQQLARAQTQPDAQQPVQGPFGTKIPKSMQDSLNAVGGSAERTGLAWLSGVNAPYEYNVRSRGVNPSDEQWKELNTSEQQYHKQMAQLSAEALAGQITPDQWRTRYHDLQQQHSGELNGIFRGAPEHTNGAQGMAAQWEDLYTQATLPDGSVDYAKLSKLQGKFEAQHSQNDLQAMNTYLNRSQSKYPMLATYHSTMGAYRQWQQDWAAKNGIDITTLQKDISDYGKVYSLPGQRAAFLRTHPDVVAYERAKRTEFDRSPTGLIYAMFYGGNTRVANFMRLTGMSEAEALSYLQAVQAQEDAQMAEIGPAIAHPAEAPASTQELAPSPPGRPGVPA
jgi:hypothetical protein